MPSSELGLTVRSSSDLDIQKGKGTKRRLTDKPGVWSDDFDSSGLYQILRPILRRHGYHYEDGETKAQVIVQGRRGFHWNCTIFTKHITNAWFNLSVLSISCFQRQALTQLKLSSNSLGGQGWPSTPVPPASTTKAARLQSYITMPSF